MDARLCDTYDLRSDTKGSHVGTIGFGGDMSDLRNGRTDSDCYGTDLQDSTMGPPPGIDEARCDASTGEGKRSTK